jgi:hypothetical protein
MFAASCPRCSAPLSINAAQGQEPCASCGAVTTSVVNPFAPQNFAPAPMASDSAPSAAHAKVCPGCRLENAPNIMFCRQCGGSLAHAAAAPAQQPFAQAAMAFNAPQPNASAWGCPTCRHENQAHHMFCLGCGSARRADGGAPLERRFGEGGNPAYSQQRSPVVLFVVIGVVLVVGAVVGVGAFILFR